MNELQSFTLQELYHYYKICKPNNFPISWNQAADLFCLEKDVIKEDHEKVHLVFKKIHSKMQRKKNK